MPRDPYYSTPVKETKHGIFIRKPPKGGSPISIIINEGEFSSIERHHLIKIKQNMNNQSKKSLVGSPLMDPSGIASDATISTDEETQQSFSYSTRTDESHSTRKEIQKDVERIRGVKTTSKLKDGPSTVPSVYQGITLETLGRVSSSLSTSMRRRSRSRSRSDNHLSSRSGAEMEGDKYPDQQSRRVKRVGDTVFKRVRSFSVSAKDKIRSRSRSIVRSIRKDKKEPPREQMVFVQQSYEEDNPSKDIEAVPERGSGFLGLGFLCGGFDTMCGVEDEDQNEGDSMQL
jgi:hypothetical protein